MSSVPAVFSPTNKMYVFHLQKGKRQFTMEAHNIVILLSDLGERTWKGARSRISEGKLRKLSPKGRTILTLNIVVQSEENVEALQFLVKSQIFLTCF